ncbi:MAG: DUF5723 family protein [Breznakibacter sp.]
MASRWSTAFRHRSTATWHSTNAFQKTGGNQWISPLHGDFDYGKLYDAIGRSLDLDARTSITPFLLGFRTKKGYFTFAYSEKSISHISLPKDLLRIGDVGLPVGSVYDLSTLRVRSMAYRELAFGYAHQWNGKLTLGVNLKPLFGHVAATTRIDEFTLNVGQERYVVSAQGRIDASFPLEVTESGDPHEAPDIDTKDLDSEDVAKYAKSFSNPGLAVDLGAQYKLNDRWWFSASLLNLGGIRWNKDVNSVLLEGSYTFEGLNVDTTNYDDLGQVAEDVLDSLKHAPIYSTGHSKFSTALSPIFHVAARYNLSRTVSLGFLSRSVMHQHDFRQDFNLSANMNLYRFFTLSANYNYRIRGNGYAGLGLGWYMGPLQFYVLADHIPFKYSVINDDGSKYPISESMKDINVMFGVNLIFGSKGYRDSPMLGER